jgi:hypothetical protein
MTRLLVNMYTLILLGSLLSSSPAFSPDNFSSSLGWTKRASSSLWAATCVEELTQPEQTIYNLVEDLHKSQYTFRIVVVGNGAILETTSELGPVMKLNTSPKTGEALLTLASQDQSFEFHLKTAEVSKVALTEKDAGEKVLRIIRFLNNVGEPMCSLILRDDSIQAVEWYTELRATYGEDVQL